MNIWSQTEKNPVTDENPVTCEKTGNRWKASLQMNRENAQIVHVAENDENTTLKMIKIELFYFGVFVDKMVIKYKRCSSNYFRPIFKTSLSVQLFLS